MNKKNNKLDELSDIYDLVPDAANARMHNEKNLNVIVRSLNEVGAARSIVIDEDGRILAGSGVTEGAIIAGINKVKVVDADGDTLIAVRRTGLSERQKRRLALYDNRATDLSEFDPAVLAHMLDEDKTILEGMQFIESELERIRMHSDEGIEDADIDFDEYDEDIDTDYKCPKCGFQWSGREK